MNGRMQVGPRLAGLVSQTGPVYTVSNGPESPRDWASRSWGCPMLTSVPVIEPINLRAASDHDYACLNAFHNLLRQEELPDDPPISLDEEVQGWCTMPDFVEDMAWGIWSPEHDRLIAFAETFLYHTGDNEHLADFNVQVRPECRRHGLARALLPLVVAFARDHQRRLLMTWSTGRVPASSAFLIRLGAHPGQVSRTNQLSLADLDHSLIARWLADGDRLSADFELGLYAGPYPEARLAEMAALFQELTKDQPRDDLELEDMNFTPDIMRQMERNMAARGAARWTLYVLHRASDRLVGLTEVFWHPDRPAILEQAFTAVRPPYRNLGLGRWLKAAMLTKILSERPEVRVVRSNNANSNAPMLKINDELGFKPYIDWVTWQVETDAVARYLSGDAD